MVLHRPIECAALIGTWPVDLLFFVIAYELSTNRTESRRPAIRFFVTKGMSIRTLGTAGYRWGSAAAEGGPLERFVRPEIIVATNRDAHLPGCRSRTYPFLEAPAGDAQPKRPALMPHLTLLRCRQRASTVERRAPPYPARDRARQCCHHPAAEPFAHPQEADQLIQT